MNTLTQSKGRTALAQTGFTLMELMIAIAVIAILAAIAFSSYENSIIKSKRKAALSTLVSLVSEQEEYFVNNKGYSTTLTGLGYANAGSTADPYYVNDSGDASTSAKGSYKIVFSAASATAFTLAAIPINAQAHDTQCATISINSSGSKTVSGTIAAESCFR